MCKYEPVCVTRDRWYPLGWYIEPTFDGPLPHAQLDARYQGQSTKGNLYTHMHTYKSIVVPIHKKYSKKLFLISKQLYCVPNYVSPVLVQSSSSKPGHGSAREKYFIILWEFSISSSSAVFFVRGRRPTGWTGWAKGRHTNTRLMALSAPRGQTLSGTVSPSPFYNWEPCVGSPW